MNTDRPRQQPANEVAESPAMSDEELNHLTERIIGCAFKVSNTLGCGFLEVVYRNALVHELRKQGLTAEPDRPVHVFYDNKLVGEFFANILVNDTVILNIKGTREHNEGYTAECLNFLRATGKPLCLLLNFGRPRVDIKRFRN